MNAKKLLPSILMALSLLIVSPTFAGNTAPGKSEVPKEVRAKQIEARLIAIKHMDMSTLTRDQKKELRKEVKSLRKEAQSQGIYLSIGAVIIIILLLILILK